MVLKIQLQITFIITLNNDLFSFHCGLGRAAGCEFFFLRVRFKSLVEEMSLSDSGHLAGFVGFGSGCELTENVNCRFGPSTMRPVQDPRSGYGLAIFFSFAEFGFGYGMTLNIISGFGSDVTRPVLLFKQGQLGENPLLSLSWLCRRNLVFAAMCVCCGPFGRKLGSSRDQWIESREQHSCGSADGEVWEFFLCGEKRERILNF